MEWVEGQYQQCAYGGKMLGGHREGKKKKKQGKQAQCRAVCSPPRHGSDFSLKNVDAFKCHI